MTEYWWNDLYNRSTRWQVLALHVRNAGHPAMAMLSGHHGRMALQINGETLFWATMLSNHSGIWRIYKAGHSAQQSLLPAIRSAEVEQACRTVQQTGYWCRYFARQLMAAPTPLLSTGRWLLRPLEPIKPAAPYVLDKPQPQEAWQFASPTSSPDIAVPWVLCGEDFPDLQAPQHVTFSDWWWSGYSLLARYPVTAASGRVKWWRKQCREGALPPVLVWFIAGLAAFVILDGHDRLQAALAEGIAPQFLVLSGLSEQVYIPDEATQARVLHSLAMQQQKGKKKAANIDAINQSLLNLYANRFFYASTYSRAVLGDGKNWEREVKAYLSHRHPASFLPKILAREA